MSVCDLGGAGVLVTRPEQQARLLAYEITQLGGAPTVFPGVEIEPLMTRGSAATERQLSDVDLVIFVSPTAVRVGMPLITDKVPLPRQLHVAAVGASTAAALHSHGLENVIAPQRGSGADALLDAPQLRDVSGWSVALIRGEGGSDALEATLTARGARVRVLECYRRRRPAAAFSVVAPMFLDGRISAWMATSGEILDNLFHMAGSHAGVLRDTPLFVNHPHVAIRAFSRAVKVIFVTAGGDKGLVAGLATWFCKLRSSTS